MQEQKNNDKHFAKAVVGVDIVTIARIERALQRTPSFKHAVFTEEEITYCESRAHPAQSYAARFAAREAVLKALGVGLAELGFHRLHDISVSIDEKGRPHARLQGAAQEFASAKGILDVAISLSHTSDVAVANAVAITSEVQPKSEEEISFAEEMLQDFKAARPLLDELDAQLATQFGKM